MKILHTEWSDGWGGQEIRIINEMVAIRAKGIEVYLACRENSVIKQKAEENNIRVFTLPFKSNFDFKSIFQLKNILKDNQIDIINTHSGKDTWIGGLSAKLSGTKFIRTRHLSLPIKSARTNFINEIADFIFTTGESIKNTMIQNNRISPEKILSVPTGVDDKKFNPKLFDKNRCKAKFGIKEDEIAIGILAVLRGFKRHDNFLKIAKNFKDTNVKFLIAGDGPQKENLITIVKENNLTNVTILGHIDNADEFLQAIDIQLLTSDKGEGVPQNLIQGLMMNKSIISSNIGSIKDLYYNNNMILLNPLDIAGFVDNIQKLLDNKLILNKNRDYIVSNFSLDAMSNKILEVYKKIKAKE